MKPNTNSKALIVMAGTLIVLLIAAVVLLSIIIVSLASEKSDPPQTSSQSTSTPTGVSPPIVTTVPPVTTTYPDPLATTTLSPTTSTQKPVVSTEAKPPVTTTAKPDVTLPGKDDYTYAPTVSETETITRGDGSIVKKGAFNGGSDAKVFLRVEWEAEYADPSATTVKLTVKVCVQSHSIGVVARPGGILSIGGASTTFTSPAIFHESNDIHVSRIYSRTVTLTKKSSAPLEVDIDAAWNFNGVYSGISIDWLTAEGTIEV